MPRLQGVIFDLDGTLLDSAPDLRQALNLMLAGQNLRPLTLEEVKSITGDGLLVMAQRALTLAGAPAPFTNAVLNERFREFLQAYRTITPDPSQIYPYVEQVLRQLQHAGVQIGLCTNKQETATYALMEQLNLRPYFNFIAGGDTFAVHKPDPGHVIGVIEALEVDTEGCVMVGDSHNDLYAARAAKIPCVIVTQGYGSADDRIEADKVIGDLHGLFAAFHELGYNF